MLSGPSTSSSASNTSPAAAISPTPSSRSAIRTTSTSASSASDLDDKLAALGATRLCDRIDCDVDLDEPFAQWKSSLYARLDDIVAARPARTAPSTSLTSSAASAIAEPVANPRHTRDNPFLAPLRRQAPAHPRRLQQAHDAYGLLIGDSACSYEAGDACGVIPQNDPRLVDEILDAAQLQRPQVPVQLPKAGATTLSTRCSIISRSPASPAR